MSTRLAVALPAPPDPQGLVEQRPPRTASHRLRDATSWRGRRAAGDLGLTAGRRTSGSARAAMNGTSSSTTPRARSASSNPAAPESGPDADGGGGRGAGDVARGSSRPRLARASVAAGRRRHWRGRDRARVVAGTSVGRVGGDRGGRREPSSARSTDCRRRGRRRRPRPPRRRAASSRTPTTITAPFGDSVGPSGGKSIGCFGSGGPPASSTEPARASRGKLVRSASLPGIPRASPRAGRPTRAR